MKLSSGKSWRESKFIDYPHHDRAEGFRGSQECSKKFADESKQEQEIENDKTFTDTCHCMPDRIYRESGCAGADDAA
jgi:hypothetical protein